jgi:hypothetical protein
MVLIHPCSNLTVNITPPQIYNVDPLRDFGTSGFDRFCSITHKICWKSRSTKYLGFNLHAHFSISNGCEGSSSSQIDPMTQLQTLQFQTHGYCNLFSLQLFLNCYTSWASKHGQCQVSSDVNKLRHFGSMYFGENQFLTS